MWLGHHFQGQRSRSPGRFTHRRVGASGSCSGWRGNVLAVRNCCYVVICSAARGASTPTHGEERGGGISWSSSAYSLLMSYTDIRYEWSCWSNVRQYIGFSIQELSVTHVRIKLHCLNEEKFKSDRFYQKRQRLSMFWLWARVNYCCLISYVMAFLVFFPLFELFTCGCRH